MNSFFSNPVIPLTQNAQKDLRFPFNFFRVEAVTGAVQFRFNNGNWITARTGRVYSALPREFWDKVEFTTTDATAQIEVTIGIGGPATGGGGGGSEQLTQGDGPPTSSPADTSSTAIYLDRTAPGLYSWNVATQAWV